MDKTNKGKSKPKNAPKTNKSSKKRNSDGPTCSMFLSELTRRFASKKKEFPENEDTSKNIVQTIITSITNALPIKFSRRSPSIKASPIKIETLQAFAPELIPNDVIEVEQTEIVEDVTEPIAKSNSYKMPKMPIVDSRVLKQTRRPVSTEDVAVDTGVDHDFASELTRHVGTLKRISLIAEEFNQKTAKNLKEIVDSVQDDLIKKLEEVKAEKQKAILKARLESNAPSTSGD